MAQWDSAFAGREVPFTFEQGELPIQRIGRVFLDQRGQILIPDIRADRILVLDSLGERRGVLRLPHPPTPAESPSTIYVTDALVACFYVPAKATLMVYDLKQQQLVRSMTVRGGVSDIVPVGTDAFLVYSPGYDGGVVRRIAADGRELSAALPISDAGARGFHGRTQNGGMTLLGDTAVAVVEPEQFAVHILNTELTQGVTFVGDTTDPLSFAIKPFPASLSPNDLTKGHTTWWNSFRHPDRVFVLADSLLLVSHYVSEGLWKGRYMVTMLTQRGELVASGLEVPFGGRVLAARGAHVIVGVPPRLTGTALLSPYRIFRYTLRRLAESGS